MAAQEGAAALSADDDVVRPGAVGEPPFVGDDRQRLRDDLLATYDLVAEEGRPRWVSLEAGTGWGKTRLVQELYARLAEDRQLAGRYWPGQLAAATDPDRDTTRGRARGTGVERRRHQLYPERHQWPADLEPAWMWWGISCADVAGTPFQALANDLTQFEAHRDALERRWRQLAKLRTRAGRQLKTRRGDLKSTAVDELVGKAVDLAGLAVPGLGFLIYAGRLAASGVARAMAGDAPVDPTGRGRPEMVADLAAALVELTSIGIPTVVVVEDFHFADQSLVDFLAVVLASDGPILVVTTAWVGLLDEEDRQASSLARRVEPDRVVRWREGEQLGAIGPEERRTLVRHLLDGVDDEFCVRLVEQLANPLLIELVCRHPRVRRAVRSGRPVPEDVLDAAVKSVTALYENVWDELPLAVRDACMAGALLDPAAVGDAGALRDERFERELVERATDLANEVRAELGDAASEAEDSDLQAYHWVGVVDPWLRRFLEPAQRAVARSMVEAQWPTDPEEVYELIGDLPIPRDSGIGETTRVLVRSRLRLAIALAGYAPWDDESGFATAVVVETLAGTPATTDARALVTLVDAIEEAVDGSASAAWLTDARLQRARALARLGRSFAAAEAYPRVVAELADIDGSSSPRCRTARREAAVALALVGGGGEAVTALRALIDELADDPRAPTVELHRARGELARVLGALGMHDAARRELEDVIDDDDLSLVVQRTLRCNLAAVLLDAGRDLDALGVIRTLVDDLEDDPDHDRWLLARTRALLVTAFVRAERPGEAEQLASAMVAEASEVFGKDSPESFLARTVRAELWAATGLGAEAVDALVAMRDEQAQLFTERAPQVLATRFLRAQILSTLDRDEEAAAELLDLVQLEIQVLGEEAPEALLAVFELVGLMPAVQEVFDLLEELVAPFEATWGPRGFPTLKLRQLLAGGKVMLGDNAGGLAALRALTPDLVASLGGAHPLARAHGFAIVNLCVEIHDRDGALAEVDRLQVDDPALSWERTPSALSVREQMISVWMFVVDSERAAEAAAALLRDRMSVDGPTAGATVWARATLGINLIGVGRREEGLADLEAAHEALALSEDITPEMAAMVEYQYVCGCFGVGDLALARAALPELRRRVDALDAPSIDFDGMVQAMSEFVAIESPTEADADAFEVRVVAFLQTAGFAPPPDQGLDPAEAMRSGLSSDLLPV